MPNPKINWVDDHTEICDQLDERVQFMQDYLDSNLMISTASQLNGSC